MVIGLQPDTLDLNISKRPLAKPTGFQSIAIASAAGTLLDRGVTSPKKLAVTRDHLNYAIALDLAERCVKTGVDVWDHRQV